MKPISCKQETGDTERLWTQEPHRVLLNFIIGCDSATNSNVCVFFKHMAKHFSDTIWVSYSLILTLSTWK